MSLLVTDVRVGGGGPIDVRIDGDRIVELGPSLPHRGAVRLLRGRGGALVPGLHDHHVHLRALAARLASVVVGPPEVRDAAALAARLTNAARETGAWVRAVGYHESVAGELDRDALDRLVPGVPVRVQHRGGALWILNSAAIRQLGLETRADPGIERDASGRVTGRLWRADDVLRDLVPHLPTDLAEVGMRAAAAGVTGFTDADPGRTSDDLVRLAGALPQHILAMGPLGLVAPDGVRPTVRVGPLKILLDDDTLPAVDDLARTVAAAHGEGRAAAFHCVTRAQLVAVVLALEQAAPLAGDRIEHGAIVPDELMGRLRRLGVTVVTQPNFVFERGDEYLAEVDADDRPLLYRCASLRAAGIPVAAGTDAPFGDPDPWVAIRAAINRETRSGAVLVPDERLAPADAFALFIGHSDAPGRARRVEMGARADLCLLHAPIPERDAVAATIIAGDVVYERA